VWNLYVPLGGRRKAIYEYVLLGAIRFAILAEHKRRYFHDYVGVNY